MNKWNNFWNELQEKNEETVTHNNHTSYLNDLQSEKRDKHSKCLGIVAIQLLKIYEN